MTEELVPDNSKEENSTSRFELEESPKNIADLSKIIVDMWFDPQLFESKGLYEKLGVKHYKKYIPAGDLVFNKFFKLSFIEDSSVEALLTHEKFTRVYETIHIISLLTTFRLIDYYHSVDSGLAVTFSLIVLNLLGNVYPIMLQRYNRLRLYGAIQKARRRKRKV